MLGRYSIIVTNVTIANSAQATHSKNSSMQKRQTEKSPHKAGK